MKQDIGGREADDNAIDVYHAWIRHDVNLDTQTHGNCKALKTVHTSTDTLNQATVDAVTTKCHSITVFVNSQQAWCADTQPNDGGRPRCSNVSIQIFFS